MVAPFAWLLVISAGFSGGCAVTKAPETAFFDAAATERTDEATRVEFSLLASNPNDASVQLREMRYRFAIGGRHVYTGRRAAQATLPAYGQTQVVVPVVIPADEPWSADADYLLTGHIQYIPPGQIAELFMDIGLLRPRAAFRQRGTVSDLLNTASP